ncbi:hypothetical protein Hanom_Chr05g00424061 [Helianthus anomalus]
MEWTELTVSNKVEVTAAVVTPPVLMFARTGAPNPIEESCRLKQIKEYLNPLAPLEECCFSQVLLHHHHHHPWHLSCHSLKA